MPFDSYEAAEILATCNGLGSVVRGTYRKSSDCLNCLKDLLLYLKRDDEEHSVLRQLGELKLLQTDLLPILKCSGAESGIFDLTLRLLVILTQPALLLYQEEIPEDKLTLNIYLSIVSYLQEYKKAFVDVELWNVIAVSIRKLLSQSYMERDEDDRLTVERILVIIRNILHVPADHTDEKRTDDDVSVHDQVLWTLHLAGIENFILYLAHNEDEYAYHLHILEIVSLIFSQKTPEILVKTGRQRTETEKREDEKKLLSARKKENQVRFEQERKLSTQRFSGVYCVKNLKSISDREHISHKLITNLDTMKFDSERTVKRIPKNRLPVTDVEVQRHSTATMCLFLKDLCSEFTTRCFNVIMSSVKRSLRNKKTEDHDDSYYLWAMYYFLCFNRLNNFDVATISESLSVQMFHYIQTQIENYYDMMMADKKKAKLWSRRIHFGLKAYRELFETLWAMGNSTEANIKRCSDVMKTNVFYVPEYRDLLMTLLMNYDEMRFPYSYLTDLIETVHLFFRMLKQYLKEHSRLIIQKKQRKRTKKAKAKPAKRSRVESDTKLSEMQLKEQWDDVVSSSLSAVLQGRKPIPEVIAPFDITSDASPEDQKVDATYKIHHALNENKSDEAVALLRAARDLWQEGDVFGSHDMDPEDEFMILREIFFANLPQRATVPSEADVVPVEEVEPELEEEEEVEHSNIDIKEQQLDLNDFSKKFASPKVIKSCYQILARYKTNTCLTNMAVLKLIHRIAWDHKMHALFFQARIFIVFQEILKDPDRNHDPVVKELSRFCLFILGKFFEVAEKNPKVFVEILFWKGSKEAYEIEEGYNSFKKKPLAGFWTEEEEEELKELFQKHNRIKITNKQLAEYISEDLQKSRTDTEIILKLKELDLIKKKKGAHQREVSDSDNVEFDNQENVLLEMPPSPSPETLENM